VVPDRRGTSGDAGPEAIAVYQEAALVWAERSRLRWLLGWGVAEALREIGVGPAAVDGAGLVARLEQLVERAAADAGSTVGVASPVIRRTGSNQRLKREGFWQGQGRRLDDRRYLVLFVGSARARGTWATLAVGVDEQGHKHVLGAWEHSTANAAVARALVAELAGRGLSAAEGLLAVVPGNPALDEAVRRSWGTAVHVAHCQHWVTGTVLAHLPEAGRPAVAARLRRAWSLPEPEAAQELADLVARLEQEHPGAAARLAQSRDAALVVARLGLPEGLSRHLRVAGPPRVAIEDAVAAAGPGKRGLAAVRAGLPAVVRRMRRLVGYQGLPQLAQELSECVAGRSR
jgi:hypothetical protein